MTRDGIIRIYSQVSDELCGGTEWCWHGVGEPLQRFAALVAAAEREECAKLGGFYVAASNIENAPDIALVVKDYMRLIRARGQE